MDRAKDMEFRDRAKDVELMTRAEDRRFHHWGIRKCLRYYTHDRRKRRVLERLWGELDRRVWRPKGYPFIEDVDALAAFKRHGRGGNDG